MDGDNREGGTIHDDGRFRTIFASEPECVKLIGRDCRLIDMNPAGLRMIEAPDVDTVRGRSIFDLIDPAYHQEFRETVDAVFGGQSTHIQFEVVGLKGRRLWMDQSAAPLFDPHDPTRVVEVVAVTRDITAQREAEAEILQAKLAEEVNRSKSDFLANISNELNTPLDQIIGYSELLQEAARDEGRHSDADDHQRVLDAAKRLVSMISQMLSIALVDAKRHKVFVDECDIRVLIHDAVEAFGPAASANKNKITIEICDQGSLWKCDGAKVDQCLRALLENAAKFTSGGAITVQASHVLAGGRSWLQLDVIDTGRGIEPSRLEQVFEPFASAESAPPREREGIGLGLAVTRQLAQIMGGELTVASALGAGSRFTLRIPAEPQFDLVATPAKASAGISR